MPLSSTSFRGRRGRLPKTSARPELARVCFRPNAERAPKGARSALWISSGLMRQYRAPETALAPLVVRVVVFLRLRQRYRAAPMWMFGRRFDRCEASETPLTEPHRYRLARSRTQRTAGYRPRLQDPLIAP